MAYKVNQLHSGLKVLFKDDPCEILSKEHVKIGRGSAFTRVKMLNFKTGRSFDETFRTSDQLEAADIVKREAKALYKESNGWFFMDEKNHEEYYINYEILAEKAKWIQEGIIYEILIWDNDPLTVILPKIVIFRVSMSEPNLKGDTAGGGTKYAQLENNVAIRVPLFVEEGDLIRVEPETVKYLGRSNE